MNFLRINRYMRAFCWFLAPPILIALVAIAYQDAPNNAFHFDDGRNITRHVPVMIDSPTFENILDAGRESFLSNRPLPSMTFAVDWWRGGGSARPFQQTNIAIHAATAVAVYALLVLILTRAGYSGGTAALAAFLAAAFWASHPIQVQAVTYVVQRMTSMAALFTVLTVLAYMLGRLQAGWRGMALFVLAAACWLLGLASKETAAIAPFLVLLAEYGVLRQGDCLVRNGLDRALLALPVVIGVAVIVDFLSGAGPLSARFLPGYDLRDFTLGERLLTQPRVILFHLSQILWPVPGRFSLEHDFPVSNGLFSPISTIAALIALLAWCAAGVWALFRSRFRVLGFWLLWLPATLAIESSFIALEMVFEHRMYMASIGLAGLAAAGLAWLLQKGGRPMVATAGVSLLVLTLLICSTRQQVPIWQSSLRLAQNSVENAPMNARSWATLASVLQNDGRRWEDIMPAVERALELNPSEFVASHIMAMYLIGAGRLDEASVILDRLAPRADRDHSVINTIGMLRLAQRDYQAAVEQFSTAAELDPFKSEFKYNLALSYELAGRCEEALATWQKYLQQSNDPQRVASVNQRLTRNFATEGGRCFDKY